MKPPITAASSMPPYHVNRYISLPEQYIVSIDCQSDVLSATINLADNGLLTCGANTPLVEGTLRRDIGLVNLENKLKDAIISLTMSVH